MTKQSPKPLGNNLDVAIITLGGTIDKIHDKMAEALGFNPEKPPAVGEIISNGRCYFPRIHALMQKDSLEMTDTDRDTIVEAVNAQPETGVILTHGTSTMGDTGRYIADNIHDKTVILTGAMRPHAFGGSDAALNMGGAIIAAQTLPHGVYGVMNGRVFPAAQLHKNTENGRFDQ